MRRPNLHVAERSDLSYAIAGSTAVVTASIRIPSTSFASTLPRMAIPDHDGQGASLNTNHFVDTVLVDLPMGDRHDYHDRATGARASCLA
jgi:hypothetical protein